LKYIRESDLSRAEVSFLLGYANPPAFTLGVQAVDPQGAKRRQQGLPASAD
jgi:hypothetical protein